MDLHQLRVEIDKTDADIIKSLGKRFNLTRQIGEFKKNNTESSIDEDRELDVIKKWRGLSVQFSVDENLSETIVRAIIDKVVEEHEAIKQ